MFCRTRRETKEVANKLIDHYNADTIHGDLSQTERDDVIVLKTKIEILSCNGCSCSWIRRR